MNLIFLFKYWIGVHFDTYKTIYLFIILCLSTYVRTFNLQIVWKKASIFHFTKKKNVKERKKEKRLRFH